MQQREPETMIVVAGRPFRITWSMLHRLMMLAPPPWMRDSAVPAPDEKARGLRALVKSVAFPFLGKMYAGLYGHPLKLAARQDTLPIIWHMMADFLCHQLMQHPLEILLDETGQTIIDIRPCRECGAASALPGHLGSGDEGAQPGAGSATDSSEERGGEAEAV